MAGMLTWRMRNNKAVRRKLMNTEKKHSEYEELMQYLEEAQAYETALILFEWDEETLAPEEAGSRTARIQGVLSSSYQRIMMSERVKELVDKCLQELTGKRAVRRMRQMAQERLHSETRI